MELTMNNPAFPDGHGFRIAGLGEVLNGETREISDVDADAFYQEHGQSLQDAFAHDPHVSLSGQGSKSDKGRKSLLKHGVHVGGLEHVTDVQDSTEDPTSEQAEAAEAGEVIQTGADEDAKVDEVSTTDESGVSANEGSES